MLSNILSTKSKFRQILHVRNWHYGYGPTKHGSSSWMSKELTPFYIPWRTRRSQYVAKKELGTYNEEISVKTFFLKGK